MNGVYLFHKEVNMPSGGKRKGAGKKPSAIKKVVFTVRLYQEIIDIVPKGKERSKWISEAIKEHSNE